MNYKHVNDLALRDQQNRCLSDELWQAVKKVAIRVCMHYDPRGRYIDDWDGLSALAVHDALDIYEHGRGDFAGVVHYRAKHWIKSHHHTMSQIVRMPLHWKGTDYDKVSTINPDGVTDDDDDSDSSAGYWDSLTATDDDSYDDTLAYEIGVLRDVVKTLSDEDRNLYDYHFMRSGTLAGYARLVGVSTQAIHHKSKWLKKRITQRMLKRMKMDELRGIK